MNDELLPYAREKIPVLRGLSDYRAFIKDFHGFIFCPYLAHKDEEAWDASTSRVYMNQALPGFLYLPVDITAGAENEIREFMNFIFDDPFVAAVNITQPHKSSPALKEMFLGSRNATGHIDTLIRTSSGHLEPLNLNAPAFANWFESSVSSFVDTDVILVGVGGVGEPIAKEIVARGAKALLLIDVADKRAFAESLSSEECDVRFGSFTAPTAPQSSIVINAAGKESSENPELERILASEKLKGVFVDLRPQLSLPTVTWAKSLGWESYTGHGMNAANDFTLIDAIARYQGTETMPFGRFVRLVAAAS